MGADTRDAHGRLICDFPIGRACGVRLKGHRKTMLPIMCPEPAVALYAKGDKQIARCTEHDKVNLALPQNAGWSRTEVPSG